MKIEIFFIHDHDTQGQIITYLTPNSCYLNVVKMEIYNVHKQIQAYTHSPPNGPTYTVLSLQTGLPIHGPQMGLNIADTKTGLHTFAPT